jgi:hypothetical protein
MITIAFKTWVETIRQLLRSPSSLAIFAGLYALLLATLYGFVSTREATVWQVIVTLSFLVLIPAEFFILQSSIIRHGYDGGFKWGQILRDSIKIAVVTIPMILIGYAIFALLNKWAAHYPIKTAPLSVWPSPKAMTAPNRTITQPMHWPTLLFATARSLIFGVILPLATIQLWLKASRQELSVLFDGGARSALGRLGRALAHAFATPAVFVYSLGLVLFVLIPYALLFLNLSPKGTKADFAGFILRLVLVFAFTLSGWIVTLASLSRIDVDTEPVPRAEVPAPAEAAV